MGVGGCVQQGTERKVVHTMDTGSLCKKKNKKNIGNSLLDMQRIVGAGSSGVGGFQRTKRWNRRMGVESRKLVGLETNSHHSGRGYTVTTVHQHTYTEQWKPMSHLQRVYRSRESSSGAVAKSTIGLEDAAE
uniref:Nitric oxide synthase, inducible n=1 Tax=Lygus hesperus TaxID=30085 RepID=A0A0A9W1B5_LYGHE